VVELCCYALDRWMDRWMYIYTYICTVLSCFWRAPLGARNFWKVLLSRVVVCLVGEALWGVSILF